MDDAAFSTAFRVIAGLIVGVTGLAGVVAVLRGLRRGATDRELDGPVPAPPGWSWTTSCTPGR